MTSEKKKEIVGKETKEFLREKKRKGGRIGFRAGTPRRRNVDTMRRSSLTKAINAMEIPETDSKDFDDEQKELYMEESEKTLSDMKPKQIRKSSVEPSLLAKVKELPTAEELGVDNKQEEEEVE